nr:glycosyltransferase family 9 protein [uncultured Desulfobacter sp.]
MIVKGASLNINKKDIKSILLIQLGDIGDLVLTLPTIETLRANFPNAHLAVAVREKAAALLQDHHAVDEIFSVDRHKHGIKGIRHQLNLLASLIFRRFDLSIELRTGTRGAVLSAASMAGIRIGRHANDCSLRELCFTHIVEPTNEGEQYAAQHNLNILEPLHLSVASSVTPALLMHKEQFSALTGKIKSLLPDSKKPILVVHPFSIWQYKELTVQQYHHILSHLAATYDVNLVITGSPDERPRAQTLIDSSGLPIVNMAGKTSIIEMACLLKLAFMVISIDTSAVHIATAVGTATVSIFGPSSTRNWAPKGNRHRVITSAMSCVPCGKKGCDDSENVPCLHGLASKFICDEIDTHIQDCCSGLEIGSFVRRSQCPGHCAI